MNVLVVGSEGFIGSRLMKRQSDWHGIDIRMEDDFLTWKPDIDYDWIIFLAARTDQTLEGYLYNLTLYNRLIELFYDEQPAILFTSSAAVMGDTIYGKSKKAGEYLIQQMFKNTSILRLSNVYGDSDGHGVIDSFINGNTVIYGDGSDIRDYIHVEKVCDAIDKVVSQPRLGKYNISTGKGTTTREVFQKYGQGEPDFQPKRDFDVPFSVLDPRAARDAGLLS